MVQLHTLLGHWLDCKSKQVIQLQVAVVLHCASLVLMAVTPQNAAVSHESKRMGLDCTSGYWLCRCHLAAMLAVRSAGDESKIMPSGCSRLPAGSTAERLCLLFEALMLPTCLLSLSSFAATLSSPAVPAAGYT